MEARDSFKNNLAGFIGVLALSIAPELSTESTIARLTYHSVTPAGLSNSSKARFPSNKIRWMQTPWLKPSLHCCPNHPSENDGANVH